MTYVNTCNHDALAEIMPNAVFRMHNDDLDQIQWGRVVDDHIVFDDEADVPVFDKDAVFARAQEIQAGKPMEYLRAERDRKLAETDWVVAKAVDASNDGLGIQLPQVWVQYRQALRDLPANTVDPANPVWPEKPQ